jgi:hypothetical protein
MVITFVSQQEVKQISNICYDTSFKIHIYFLFHSRTADNYNYACEIWYEVVQNYACIKIKQWCATSQLQFTNSDSGNLHLEKLWTQPDHMIQEMLFVTTCN